LSIAPTLQPERVYGDFDSSIMGAKTNLIKYAPTNNLKGQLNISFYISSDTISPNNVDRLFELVDIADPSNNKRIMSEDPIHGNVVGRYSFDNMFLTSFNFEMSPFQLIRANATYDIYGTINKTIDRYFSRSTVDFAHSMKSFGEIKIGNQQSSEQLKISSLRYNIQAERKTSNRIRENENTAINTYAGGALPCRVSVESIVSEVNIESSDMIENLNPYGDQQLYMSPDNISDSKVDIFLYSLDGYRMSRFSCKGKIHNQSMNISEGSHAKSSITIREIIR